MSGTCLRGCRDCPELSPDLGALVLFGAGWDIGWDIRSDTAGDSEMWAFFGGGIISEPVAADPLNSFSMPAVARIKSASSKPWFVVVVNCIGLPPRSY